LAAGSMLSEPLLGLLIESLSDESTSARAARLPARFPYLALHSAAHPGVAR